MAGDFLGGVDIPWPSGGPFSEWAGCHFVGVVWGSFLGWCGGDKNGGRHSVSGQGVISWVCESHFWGRVE